MATVHGRVTLDGQPVESGSVEFWPSTGRGARGEIASDGTYALTTFEEFDGAIVGAHEVTVEALVAEQGAAPAFESLEQERAHFSDPKAAKVRAQRIRWIVPERYAHRKTSGLTRTVESGDNTIDLELTSRPSP